MDVIEGKVHATIFFSKDLEMCIIRGEIKETVKNKQISYNAANIPDYRASFSGSALPFPNQTIAFENSTKGIVKLNNMNRFEIMFGVPNSYYRNLGSILVKPTLYIQYNNGFVDINTSIVLRKEISHRLLTYPSERTNPMFYNNVYQLPVRSQEQILRESAYKLIENSESFWDRKPAL